MANKHYDINYLQKSRQLLLHLKESSYGFFSKIEEGTIVDLGCGAGNDVIELAKLAGDGVKIIGIDHDPVMVQKGKEQAKDLSNVDFLLSEAWPLPFENDSLSGLRTERVIQHLPYPEKTVQDIHRVLKSDQPLVIIETDWQSLSFYTEFTEVQRKLSAYLTDVKVNNGFAARKLTRYLELSKFREIKFEIHPFVVNTLEEANEYFWIEKMAREAADKGYMDESEYYAFYNALQKANEANYFACSINLVVASCIK